MSTPLPTKFISNWKVNDNAGGNSMDGTIMGTGSTVTYTAPATVDEAKTMQVSAELNQPVKMYNNGKLIGSFTKYIFFTDIKLDPLNLSFNVKVVLTEQNTSVAINDVYTDGVTMQVDVTYDPSALSYKVKVSKISNQEPSVSPSSGPDGSFTYIWINDGFGLVSVDTAYGMVEGGISGLGFGVHIDVIQKGALTPEWQVSGPGITTYTGGGIPITGFPTTIDFFYRDATHMVDPTEIGQQGDLYITVTTIQ